MAQHLTHLIVHPTLKCNLRCRYCWENGKRPDTMMSKNTLYGIANYISELSDLKKSKQVHIDWMGGEPLMMGMEFYDTARTIFEGVCDPKFFFRTNLSLIDEKWAEYIKDNNINIGGSLDGPKDIHDAQRSNSYDACMTGFNNLRDHECRISDVACTVTQESSQRLPELFDFLEGLGVGSFVFNAEICAMSPIQMSFIYQQLYHLWADHGRPLIFPRFGEFQERIKSVMSDSVARDCSKGGCGQGWTILDPDGGCHLCNHENCSRNTYFGNVNDAPAKELWDSPHRIHYFERVKNVRKSQCGDCIFRYVCNGTCYHHVLSLGGEYDPYCGIGYHTYEVIIESLGYTMDEYREAVQQLEAKQGGIA